MDNPSEDLAFLRSKIESIKTALFKTEYNYTALIPNNVIRTLYTDDAGNIWFITSVTEKYEARNNNELFYAYLEYHHKGNNASLRIGGMAAIADNNEAEDLGVVGIEEMKRGKLVLVKLKIMQAAYNEYNLRPYEMLAKLKNFWSSLVSASGQQRSFDFS